MKTVSDICDEIGRQKLATELGVGKAAISNAVASNRFPAAWYRTLSEMCQRAETSLPDELFGWKSAQEDAA